MNPIHRTLKVSVFVRIELGTSGCKTYAVLELEKSTLGTCTVILGAVRSTKS